MRSQFKLLLLVSLVAARLHSQSTAPSISLVSPTPLVGPTSPGVFFTGTFVVSGQNLQGGSLTTDGPLNLTGSSTINSTGAVITQGYSIGCCAPQRGQTFHLFVTTPNGSASISDTITLSATAPNTCVNFPVGLVPLSSIAYVTAANAAGDHLVVGTPTNGLNTLAQIPFSAAINQLFCDASVQLAPQQFFPSVYVPT